MAVNLGALTDAENRFRSGFSEFARSWAVVRENWLDDRCRKFEMERLSTIGPSLSRFTAAMHEFQDVVRQADRELTDPDRPSDSIF
jgi:hypothetical protein